MVDGVLNRRDVGRLTIISDTGYTMVCALDKRDIYNPWYR